MKDCSKCAEYERGYHDGIKSEATKELVACTSELMEGVTESIRKCLSKVNIEAIAVKKTGYWIISSDGYYPYCSECGYRPKEMTKFCGNCGVEIREKDEHL